MTDEPTGEVRERIAKAVKDAPPSTGKVLKVLFMDEQGEPVGEWASTQLPEDPFSDQYKGLREPPFPLAQLVYLAETHPVHSAALEQKTVDICGKGWEWAARDKETADETQKEEIIKWFEGLAPDELDMKEVIQSAWLDVETTGWGLLELARDPAGVVQRAYHVPAHTVRAHKDGFRLCQVREERKVWFRRWGAPLGKDGAEIQVDVKTGSMRAIRDPANDMFVIRRPSRRSTWYGIPGYVSAIGWITLALAARDDNLFFFANRREPRWAIILSNLEDDPDVQDDLRRAFTIDLKQPYRNILVPITGPGKVDFQKLSDNRQEGSFDRLSERADKAIMVAHRTPAERLANASIGPLGGNATLEASRIYKEGVVGPSQELLQNRLNRLIDVEFSIFKAGGPAQAKKLEKAKAGDPKPDDVQWLLVMDDLDIASDREDLEQTMIAFHGDLITLREARHAMKLGPLEGENEEESPYNDMLFSELPGNGKAGTPDLTPAPVAASRDLSQLDYAVRQLLVEARDTSAKLDELATAQE